MPFCSFVGVPVLFLLLLLVPRVGHAADLNGDDVTDALDLEVMTSRLFTDDPEADLNQDGIVDLLDVAILRETLSADGEGGATLLPRIQTNATGTEASSSGATAANILYLEPASLSVPEGTSVFELTLRMDFQDVTLGGAVLLDFDPAAIGPDSVEFSETLGDDPDLRCPGSTVVMCPEDPTFLSFGSFDGLTGAHEVATLRFGVIDAGSTPTGVDLLEEHPFADDDPERAGEALDVALEGSLVFVPEPEWDAVAGTAVALLMALRVRRSVS